MPASPICRTARPSSFASSIADRSMPTVVIDLSYAAAYRLGYINTGSTQVEVESIVPGEDTALAFAPARAAPAPVATRDEMDTLVARLAAEPAERPLATPARPGPAAAGSIFNSAPSPTPTTPRACALTSRANSIGSPKPSRSTRQAACIAFIWALTPAAPKPKKWPNGFRRRSATNRPSSIERPKNRSNFAEPADNGSDCAAMLFFGPPWSQEKRLSD